MNKIICLYIDDSGTRHPDHKPNPSKHNYDYFAFGGILIKEEDETEARRLYAEFCKKWTINYPLHSVDIRGNHKKFSWLGRITSERYNSFMNEYYQLLESSPVIGIACTIDRPGYNHRYRERYGRERWALCKTAFSIIVERAVKYADSKGCKLRVLPERCNEEEDKKLKQYYEYLKKVGLPFDGITSSQYDPLKADIFKNTLYEFKLKNKESPMAQLADLYLWPMVMGGYDKNHEIYKRLLEDKKLIDAFYSEGEIQTLGIKYSCFDLVNGKPDKII